METWFGGLLPQDLMAHLYQLILREDLFTLFMAPMDLHYLQMMKEGYLDLMESHYQLMRVCGAYMLLDLMGHLYQQIQRADLSILFMGQMDHHCLLMMLGNHLGQMVKHYQQMLVENLWVQKDLLYQLTTMAHIYGLSLLILKDLCCQLINMESQFTLCMDLMAHNCILMKMDKFLTLMDSHYQQMKVENQLDLMVLPCQQMIMEIWFGAFMSLGLMAHRCLQIQRAGQFIPCMGLMAPVCQLMIVVDHLDPMESHCQQMKVESLLVQQDHLCQLIIMGI
uniref:Uncharacterized protein n=1 Tax=Plectus sambesii TaxID=2011161 RepID=A0A914WE96_9BILA